MRFYLNLPLVAGYALMATTACLGMLQFAAARGGYAGLSLFTAKRHKGQWLGGALLVGSLIAYVSLAPEILTPGPAGSEVAGMFSLCALAALTITLSGAHWRLLQVRHRATDAGGATILGSPNATLFWPSPSPPQKRRPRSDAVPAVVLVPDPMGFVIAPTELIEGFQRAGIALLLLDRGIAAKKIGPLSEGALSEQTSTALAQLRAQAEVDTNRIGVLGLGLAGDLILKTAANDPAIKVLAVASPVALAPLTPRQDVLGLHWLHEVSYAYAWRWRRQWPRVKRVVTRLQASVSKRSRSPFPAAVLHRDRNGTTLTTRSSFVGVESLGVPSERHFTLLEDERARQTLLGWFQENL